MPRRPAGSHNREEGAVCPQGDVHGGQQKPEREEGLCVPGDVLRGGQRIQSQEEGAVCPQEMSSCPDSRSQSLEGKVLCPQGMSSLQDSRSQSERRGAVCPQEMSTPCPDSRSQSLGRCCVSPGDVLHPGDSRNHTAERKVLCVPRGQRPELLRNTSQKECPVMPQGKYSMGSGKFPKQEGPERAPGDMSLGVNKCYIVRKAPETGAKTKATKKKSSNFQHQQKPAIHPIQNCWECLHCKAVDFPRQPRPATPYKIGCRAFESGGLDQDKLTDFRKVSRNGNTPRKNQFPNNLSSFDQK